LEAVVLDPFHRLKDIHRASGLLAPNPSWLITSISYVEGSDETLISVNSNIEHKRAKSGCYQLECQGDRRFCADGSGLT